MTRHLSPLARPCQSPTDSSPTGTPSATPARLERRLVRDLACVSTRDGNSEIYSMTSIGSQQTNLSHNTAEDLDPS